MRIAISRPWGRLFFWCVLLSAALATVTPLRAATAKTLIQDVLYKADGTPSQGTLLISWPAFNTAAGDAIAAGSLSVPLGTGGSLRVSLFPNAGSTPAGTYYKVVLDLDSGGQSTEYWVVPQQAQTTVAAIRSRLVPTSQAVQTVTRDYVDAAIAATVSLAGDQSISGVKSFASSPLVPAPRQVGEAASKGYVDTATLNLASRSYVDSATANAVNRSADGTVAIGTTCPAGAAAGTVCAVDVKVGGNSPLIAAGTPRAGAIPAYGDAGGNTLGPSAFSAASLNGFRNRLINADGSGIDQRHAGAAQTIVAGAALSYTIDRWYAYASGANVTAQRIAGSGGARYRYQFTGAAGVTGIGFGQRIEASNSFDLAGQTATLSAELANSLLTTVTWTAYYANSTDAFGTLASPTRTQIAAGTWAVTSTIARYSTQISVPAAATTGIEIVLSIGAQTGGTWTIGSVQLEPGGQATPLERRPYGMELALAQRYYAKTFNLGTTPQNGVGQAGAIWVPPASTAAIAAYTVRWQFPIRMRSAPAVGLYDPSNSQSTASWFDSAGNSVAASATNAGETGVTIYNAGGNVVVGRGACIHATADAEL